jgi:hypothetical protein
MKENFEGDITFETLYKAITLCMAACSFFMLFNFASLRIVKQQFYLFLMKTLIDSADFT